MGIHTQKVKEDEAERWHDAQHDEKGWWGNCVNTFWEETKQLVYAEYMGLKTVPNEQNLHNFNMDGKDVLDIGGGPVSMLLKTIGKGKRVVVDPCDYPAWIGERYKAANITYLRGPGEQIGEEGKYDEVWIYNVLQHTDDPYLILINAKVALKPGGILRIFEWIDTEQNIAHPHILTEELLNSWTKQTGNVAKVARNGCYGNIWYGAFEFGLKKPNLSIPAGEGRFA